MIGLGLYLLEGMGNENSKAAVTAPAAAGGKPSVPTSQPAKAADLAAAASPAATKGYAVWDIPSDLLPLVKEYVRLSGEFLRTASVDDKRHCTHSGASREVLSDMGYTEVKGVKELFQVRVGGTSRPGAPTPHARVSLVEQKQPTSASVDHKAAVPASSAASAPAATTALAPAVSTLAPAASAARASVSVSPYLNDMRWPRGAAYATMEAVANQLFTRLDQWAKEGLRELTAGIQPPLAQAKRERIESVLDEGKFRSVDLRVFDGIALIVCHVPADVVTLQRQRFFSSSVLLSASYHNHAGGMCCRRADGWCESIWL
jgi:hypothetical protein